MAQTLISEDGRWWWDGTRWRSRLVEGELDMFWFTTTPDWFTRILITGLIMLIPIAGSINTYGWTLAAVDMVRGRWRELPPAGFHHLERGVRPFLVSLVYGLVAFLVIGLLAGGAVLLAISDHSRIPIAIALGFLVLLLTLGWWLLLLYIFAAMIIGSDRLGVARALNPRTLLAITRANRSAALAAGATYLVAALVLSFAGSAVGVVVPFGALVVSVALPAVFAMIVPSLAKIEVQP